MQAVPKSLIEQWKTFLLARNICPECLTGDNVFPRGMDLVCTECGTVLGPLFNTVHRVPGVGRNTHFSPEGALCHGDDKGNPSVDSKVDRFALMRVLHINDPDELRRRVIQMKAELALAQECARMKTGAITRRMKRYVSGWMKDFGWHTDGMEVFAGRIGRHINWIGGLCDLTGNGSHSRDLAAALLVLDATRWWGKNGPEIGRKVKKKLGVKPEHIKTVHAIIQLRANVDNMAKLSD